MNETEGLQKIVSKHKNSKQDRKKFKATPKPTLDDKVAEMNDKQREQDKRVKQYGPEETTPE